MTELHRSAILPRELIDKIIDLVAGETYIEDEGYGPLHVPGHADLIPCSSASSSLRASASRYLFANLKFLAHASDWNLFRDIILSSPTGVASSFTFIYLLPALAQVDVDDIVDFALSRMVNVKRLVLGGDMGDWAPHMWRSLSILPITSVHLVNVRF